MVRNLKRVSIVRRTQYAERSTPNAERKCDLCLVTKFRLGFTKRYPLNAKLTWSVILGSWFMVLGSWSLPNYSLYNSRFCE